MPFRRPKRDINPDHTRWVADLADAYEEGVALCRRVATADGRIDDELRRRALETAVLIGFRCRWIWSAITHLDLLDHTLPEHSPVGPLGACARLAYSLTATAEPEPDPETILTSEDIDSLPFLYDLNDWLKAFGKPTSDAYRRNVINRKARFPGLDAELTFLTERQPAMVALLARDYELYPSMLERFETEGPSPELSATPDRVRPDPVQLPDAHRRRQRERPQGAADRQDSRRSTGARHGGQLAEVDRLRAGASAQRQPSAAVRLVS